MRPQCWGGRQMESWDVSSSKYEHMLVFSMRATTRICQQEKPPLIAFLKDVVVGCFEQGAFLNRFKIRTECEGVGISRRGIPAAGDGSAHFVMPKSSVVVDIRRY